MTTTVNAVAPDSAVSERGRWYVAVPWEQADDIHYKLSRRGCPSTLCIDPYAHEAKLELWPGVTPDHVLGMLAEMQAGDRTRPVAV